MEAIAINQIPSYEMFSKAGDKMCHTLVTKIENRIKSRYRVTKEEILQMISEGMKKIAEKHGEVNDTEPEYYICTRINNACKEVGYEFDINRFDI